MLKKVLLLNPPSDDGMVIKDQYCSFTSKAGYYWIPVDLLVLSGDLADAFDLRVIDSIVEGISKCETIKRIKEFSPDHIVILSSVLTQESDRFLVRELKRDLSFKTTFIGDIFYFSTKEMLKFEEVDSILYEYPCPELVDFIKEGTADCNVAYKENGDPVFLPNRRNVEIKYQTPAHHLFNLKKYSVPFMEDEICTSVLTNFGCKFTCKYCPADSVSFRERSISDIVEELSYLKKMGIQNIWIRDFTFGLNKERTKDFLAAIQTMGIRWFCLSRSEILEKSLLEKMAASGCYLVMIGVDTSSEKVMENVQRRQNLLDIKNRIELTHLSGIQVLVHLILGLPGEDLKSMLGTIHFLARTKASYLSINYFSPRAGSTFFSIESIFNHSKKRMDSNNSENLGLIRERIILRSLKYYALLTFYFNPLRIIRIISSVKTKKQFLTIIKTGYKMFLPFLQRKEST